MRSEDVSLFYLSPRRSRLCFFLVKMVRFTQPFFLQGFCLRWRTQRSRWIAALCTYEVAAAALCAWTGRRSTRRDLTISKSSLPNGKQKEEEGSRRYPCNKVWICPCDLWATVIPKAALWWAKSLAIVKLWSTTCVLSACCCTTVLWDVLNGAWSASLAAVPKENKTLCSCVKEKTAIFPFCRYLKWLYALPLMRICFRVFPLPFVFFIWSAYFKVRSKMSCTYCWWFWYGSCVYSS